MSNVKLYNYNYYPMFDEHDCLEWHVHEAMTDQIVGKFLFEEDARDCVFFLERGGGFAGFTPSFILNRVPLQVDIDAAFAAEFT